MNPRLFSLSLAFILLMAGQTANAQCVDMTGCVLVFSDEFDGAEVDLSKWTLLTGDGTDFGLPAGWGNNELQWYQEDNATVADGFLTITAREEVVNGYNYTSSRMITENKADFTYGRMEMRARMPITQGMWPAYWMFFTGPGEYGGWAASGEIDIMEYIGSEPDEVFGTIHFGEPFPGNLFASTDFILDSGTFNDDFHTFAIEWEPGEIRWYVDDILYSTRNIWWSNGGNYPAPFDQDFHLLLNLAVGGNLPGNPDDTSVFPQEYVIDYVRVYQSTDLPEVAITSPMQDDNLAAGLVTITADASATMGVTSVEFLQGDFVLGEDTTSPYEITVDNVAEGPYRIRAKVTDGAGKINYSDFVDITVGSAAQGPYSMVAAPIPGIVELENFDTGGPDVAFVDNDPTTNQGSKFSGNLYRNPSGVDIEPTTDIGGGSNIGFTATGESIEYTVNVEQAGLYDVEFRVAAASATGALRLEFDGEDKTGLVTFDATGGFQTWETVRKEDVALEAGQQIMTVVMEGSDFNLNNITFVVADPTSGEKVVFDDMEHGDPINNGWFAFGGAVGGGGIDPNFTDLPPANGGAASLQTGWGSGGVPGFFGGFGRTNPVNLAEATFFNLWILPDAGQDYTLEINLQDDDNGDNAIPDTPDGEDDEFQFNCTISETGPCAISGGGWQLVSIPLSDFVDDNSFHFGGNGVLDGVPVSEGGNGSLINVVVAVISNSGADVNFRTDYWSFTNGPLGAEIALDPLTFDFGGVSSGSSALKAFTITNEGCTDLEVTALSFGGDDAAEFSIFSGMAPFTVPAGGSEDVVVSFNPASEGPKTATLIIENSDADEGVLEIALNGEGTESTGNKLVFDDMEHGDPVNNGWFSFTGAADGGIDPNSTDLPPENGGTFSLQTGWGSGGASGFFGGFGRETAQDLFGKTYFNMWINPDAGQDYVIEVNLQDDDNGDNSIDNPNDDEFQYNLTVGPEGSGAEVISGGGWQLVSIPFEDFFDDNSIFTGGNGVFDPISTTSGGNGQLINVVLALISNTGADISFRTDYWVFTEGPLGPGIAVTPEEFDFGAVAPGSNLSQVFTVTNEGCSDLEVTATTLVGANAAEFNIESGGGVFTLAPGASEDITVSFNPIGGGAKFAFLEIQSNDTNNNPLNVQLSGNQDVLEGKVLYDDMEHGNPFGNGWFAFGGAVGGGGIDPNGVDLAPVNGGVFGLQTGWGSGGVPGFFGGFGRTETADLTGMTHFNFWINPDAGQDYVLEINLQDDDDGDNASTNPNDDEFQYTLSVGPEGSGAEVISGGGWQLVSIPLDAFVDDNSFLTGGNGVLDPISVANGGNGQLTNVVFAVISNSGADVTFRTDFWCFSDAPFRAELAFDDMEHGAPFDNGWFTFGGAVGGGGIDPNDADLPPLNGGLFSLQTGWGSGGVPGFFGGFGRTNPVHIADMTHFNFWINPDAGQDFLLEINLQEDDDGDNAFPFPAPNDDEFQYNCVISDVGPCAISGGGWQLVSIPFTEFFDDNSIHGGNGIFDPVPVNSGGNGQLIGIVIAVLSNSGADATFRTDYWSFTDGPLEEAEIAIDPAEFDFGAAEIGSSVSGTFTITNEGIANLLISGASVDNTDNYAVISGGDAISVPSGATHTIEVAFSPAVAPVAALEGVLAVASNDADENPATAALTGQGVPAVPHDFVFLGDDEVKFERLALGEGEVHSNNVIRVMRGGRSLFTGNLTAVDDVFIARGNTVDGDVTAGGEVFLGCSDAGNQCGNPSGITITGTITEGAEVEEVPLPELSFTAGGEDINVRAEEPTTLEPGSYGRIRLNPSSTLNLSSGAYFFEELTIAQGAMVAVDVTEGPVAINVEGTVIFHGQSGLSVVPLGADGSRWVTLNSMEHIFINRGVTVYGSLVAPYGTVMMERESLLRGGICALEIDARRGASVEAHGPVGPVTVLEEVLTGKAGSTGEQISKGDVIEVPAEYGLDQNYPNPFNPSTQIRFQLPEAQHVKLAVYNMLGQRVALLTDAPLAAGYHEVQFNASQLPSGTYIYRITAGNFQEVRRMVLVK